MDFLQNDRQVLEEFLSYSLKNADQVFQCFERLPRAIVGKGKNSLERYVCIPGSRKDRIVLVAHADTVWDIAYGVPAEQSLYYENGCYKSKKPECGIGADDRAGCAMLWLLRDCGHTILLLNGEEKGKRGAYFLKESNPKLFRMLNKHRFMIELDSHGTSRCNFNQVDNTKRFRKYITKTLGFRDDTKRGGCDLQVLCQSVCGVNVAVGYYNHHTRDEQLVLSEWEHTLTTLKAFLTKSHPRFGTDILARLCRLPRKIKYTAINTVESLFSRWIARKTKLSKVESQELAKSVLIQLYKKNGLRLWRNWRWLQMLFADIDWRKFCFTEEKMKRHLGKCTRKEDYRPPIGSWLTIDSEKDYAGEPEIQNTKSITYYASGREPFLAIINHIAPERKVAMVPYFICGTVYQPFIENGWELVYYNIKKNLRADVGDIRQCYQTNRPSIAIFMEYSGTDLNDEEIQVMGELKNAGCVTIVDRTQNIYSQTRRKEADYYCGSIRNGFGVRMVHFWKQPEIAPLPPPPATEAFNNVYATTRSAMMFANGLAQKSKIQEYADIGEFFRRFAGSYVCSAKVRERNMSSYSKRVYLQECANQDSYVEKRKENSKYILQRIAGFETMRLASEDFAKLDSAPFCVYVYANNKKMLETYLSKHGIMIWNRIPRPRVHNCLDEEQEYMFQHLVALPCDQSNTIEDMRILCDILEMYEKETLQKKAD